MGRPPGPAEDVRRNKVGTTVTDAEREHLEQIADERGVPVSVVIYELISRMLRRRK
jgi:antitoxin component of RelBE/YafQ-DinJ toxin-antitoxin module